MRECHAVESKGNDEEATSAKQQSRGSREKGGDGRQRRGHGAAELVFFFGVDQSLVVDFLARGRGDTRVDEAVTSRRLGGRW
jgi:hypothetical protein